MWGTRFPLAVLAGLAGLAVGACARQQAVYYVADPNTGRPVAVTAQQQFAPPRYAQQGYHQPAHQQSSPAQSERALYSSSPAYAQQAYDRPQHIQQIYAQPAVTPPRAAPSGSGRGLFTQGRRFSAQSQHAVPQGGPYIAASTAYAPPTSSWSRSDDSSR
jgi:hypothetical protein